MEHKIAILMGTRGNGWWPIAVTNDEASARATSSELNVRAGAGHYADALATMVVMVDQRDMELKFSVGEEVLVHRVTLEGDQLVEDSLYSVPFSESSDPVWTGFDGSDGVDLLALLGDDGLGRVLDGSSELYAATDPSWDPGEVLGLFRNYLEARGS